MSVLVGGLALYQIPLQTTHAQETQTQKTQTLETGLQFGGRCTGGEDALGRRQNRVEG